MNDFKRRLIVTPNTATNNKTASKLHDMPINDTMSNTSHKEIYYVMYDENKKRIGIVNARNEKLQNNWLRGVSIFVITEDETLILEQRSRNTKLTPDQTDLCSGHIDNEEKAEETVYRELQEELGIKKKQVLKLKKINSEVPLVFKGNRKFFIQFYAGFIKGKKEKLKLQEEEVSNTEEVPLEEGFELIRQGKTKFPYKGKEEEFEQIFNEIRQFCKNQKERKQEQISL